MSTINQLLKEQMALLSLAEAEVTKRRRQIDILKEMANGDDYSTFLQLKRKAPFNVNASPDKNQALSPILQTNFVDEVESIGTKTGRNKKGEARKQILALLSDGNERDIDSIKSHLDTVLANPLPRAPLRTALMYLRKANEIESRKAGYFNVPAKGETRL